MLRTFWLSILNALQKSSEYYNVIPRSGCAPSFQKWCIAAPRNPCRDTFSLVFLEIPRSDLRLYRYLHGPARNDNSEQVFLGKSKVNSSSCVIPFNVLKNLRSMDVTNRYMIYRRLSLYLVLDLDSSTVD